MTPILILNYDRTRDVSTTDGGFSVQDATRLTRAVRVALDALDNADIEYGNVAIEMLSDFAYMQYDAFVQFVLDKDDLSVIGVDFWTSGTDDDDEPDISYYGQDDDDVDIHAAWTTRRVVPWTTILYDDSDTVYLN